MKKILMIAGFLLVSSVSNGSAHGQATQPVAPTPEYGGFDWPTVPGELNYSVNAGSQTRFGYAGSSRTVEQGTITGNVGFQTGSVIHPLALKYSGGYLASNNGGQTGYVQNMDLTQSYNRRNWSVTGSDSLLISPEYDGTGPAGIAGTGNSGLPPPSPPESVLLSGGDRLTNTAMGNFQRSLTGKMAINARGEYSILRFLSSSASSGIESNSTTGGGGLSRRIDALSSASVNYNYLKFDYLSSPSAIVVQSFQVGYSRQLNRKLMVSVSGGPERVGGSSTTGASANYNVALNALAGYTTENWTGSVSFDRSTHEGGGVSLGSRVNEIEGNASTRLGRQWHLGASLSYFDNQGLTVLTTTPFSSRAVTAGTDLSRQIARYFSVFVSFSDEHQVSNGTSQSAFVYSGNTSSVGFGVTYTPRAINLGRK